jgi:hypothetical protein
MKRDFFRFVTLSEAKGLCIECEAVILRFAQNDNW